MWLERYKVLWDKAKENLDLHARIETLQQDIAEAEATAEEENLQNWDKLVRSLSNLYDMHVNGFAHSCVKTQTAISTLTGASIR